MYYILVINVNCYSTKVENFANERIFQGLDGVQFGRCSLPKLFAGT